MDMEHLLHVLAAIQRDEIEVVEVETAAPSPVAAGLLAEFVAIYMYEGDAPKAERQCRRSAQSRAAGGPARRACPGAAAQAGSDRG